MICIGLLIAGTIMSCQKIEKYYSVDLLVNKEWLLKSTIKNSEEYADSCKLDNGMLFNKSGEMVIN